MRATIAELLEAGYLVRVQNRDGGRFGEVDYRLTAPSMAQSTADGFSGDGETAAGKTGAGESDHKEDHLEEDHPEELMLVPAGPSASDRFEEFWKVYPRKVAKGTAKAAFLRLVKKHDVEAIIGGARRLAADPNLPEQQFVKHPTTWLNGEGWDDEPLPERIDRVRPPQDDDGEFDWLRARS
ncbi:hypothetical protein [Rathayibacter sp. VKM Ac-2630]|uniref:hypothetical protein n=1 Tax=Rathayibacter sp. VKM Ac-2630 TaxID=1938617 RepID=UPI0011159BD1|nr:hypothetical protein [Rathayibacter sp. VKM Ac-2630]